MVGWTSLRPRARRLVLSSAVAGVLLLSGTGCGSQPRETPASSSTAAAARPVGSATATRAPADGADEATPGSRRSAVQVATAAVRAFCHPERDAAAWFAALSPYLTADAQAAYSSVLPSRVPCSAVTGAATAGSGDGFTQLVTVPTDAGDCSVWVQRPRQSSPWRVARIVLPERA